MYFIGEFIIIKLLIDFCLFQSFKFALVNSLFLFSSNPSRFYSLLHNLFKTENKINN